MRKITKRDIVTLMVAIGVAGLLFFALHYVDQQCKEKLGPYGYYSHGTRGSKSGCKIGTHIINVF